MSRDAHSIGQTSWRQSTLRLQWASTSCVSRSNVTSIPTPWGDPHMSSIECACNPSRVTEEAASTHSVRPIETFVLTERTTFMIYLQAIFGSCVVSAACQRHHQRVPRPLSLNCLARASHRSQTAPLDGRRTGNTQRSLRVYLYLFDGHAGAPAFGLHGQGRG